MSDALVDDREELKNICHSAKKFTLRYVLPVSAFANLIYAGVIRLLEILSRPRIDGVADCQFFRRLQSVSRREQR